MSITKTCFFSVEIRKKYEPFFRLQKASYLELCQTDLQFLIYKNQCFTMVDCQVQEISWSKNRKKYIALSAAHKKQRQIFMMQANYIDWYQINQDLDA